ncbi:4-phosphoerythronate dehydrogenase [Pseudidiomarina insulisalsae]|uniref:Erythronate-4-phosphate dehydrogenase n=1 Tax=Pseudidiomarina insulisalsae TaxID=575789 RepID=A0A432YLU6_9GAMM|nr:4-phosphoerythronate dehydrogenase [Pseudidiomarina insulisalsae]RUO61923.1 4-phosphoerythronate dehydrogenase [Pseudidiomarina insulisalsae]
MLLLADANLPAFDRLVAAIASQSQHSIELARYEGRQPDAGVLAQADALFIRSVTTVDADLLTKAPRLNWLGTATIGTDHVDLTALAEAGIRFHSTPGVNANAVGDYVASAVAAISLQQGALPAGEVAIVGAGNTGRAAGQRLQGLGLKVHYYDPPLAAAGQKGVHSDWQRVLASAVISCHVPLSHAGEYATWHLFDAAALQQISPQTLLINASRGPVVAEQALIARLQQYPQWPVVLDVWEHEPQLQAALVERVQLATPHIAGHSFAGKLGGSWQLLQKWLTDQRLALQLPDFSELFAGFGAGQPRQLSAKQAPDWQQLARWILAGYDIRNDDQALRAQPLTAAAFDSLRRNYAVRAELSQLHLQTGPWAHSREWSRRLAQLTFQITE